MRHVKSSILIALAALAWAGSSLGETSLQSEKTERKYNLKLNPVLFYWKDVYGAFEYAVAEKVALGITGEYTSHAELGFGPMSYWGGAPMDQKYSRIQGHGYAAGATASYFYEGVSKTGPYTQVGLGFEHIDQSWSADYINRQEREIAKGTFFPVHVITGVRWMMKDGVNLNLGIGVERQLNPLVYRKEIKRSKQESIEVKTSTHPTRYTGELKFGYAF